MGLVRLPPGQSGIAAGLKHAGTTTDSDEGILMPAKEIEFNEDARRSMREGIDALANAVKTTLSIRAGEVLIEPEWN